MVLTWAAASDVRRDLALMEPAHPQSEKQGLAHFVDASSRSIGAEDDASNCAYVDGPLNLNALSTEVNKAQSRFVGEHPRHRLVLDSVSTLAACTNAQATFRFLQVSIGKAKRAGATTSGCWTGACTPTRTSRPSRTSWTAWSRSRSSRARTSSTSRVRGYRGPRLGGVQVHPPAFEATGSFAAGRIR